MNERIFLIKNVQSLRIRTVALLAAAWLSTPSAVVAAASLQPASAPDHFRVDFRYALPWWQSAACLPDDPDKVLVGKEGQLLTEFSYESRGVRFFDVFVQHDVAGGSTWIKQELHSGRVPIVKTIKRSGDVSIEEEIWAVVPPKDTSRWEPLIERLGGEKVVAGWDPPKKQRVLYGWAKPEESCDLAFNDVAVSADGPIQYRLSVDGSFVRCDQEHQILSVGHNTRYRAALAIARFVPEGQRKAKAQLQALELEPGTSQTAVLAIYRNALGPVVPVTASQAARQRKKAADFWNTPERLPYDLIRVPDPGIQQMIDSSIRNIWQARDIKNGLPAFHVGPTVYRCLWLVDGAFLLETATMLGRGNEARAGINYTMGFQETNGGFQLKARFWKESGLVLWTVTRHAFLTQDKEWLRQHWPNLKRAFAFIQWLRNVEGAADPAAPEYRLLPWGDIDGGINNTKPDEKKGEYSNVHWCLIGMKSAIEAARWLGEDAQAAEWQKEFEDFYATYRKAAERDVRPDRFGNRNLPIIMGDALHTSPQKAQWTFCHAVYPGQLFAKDDPLAVGTLNMLRATEVQGLVFDTGWMKDGIWCYFASFYGHALLWEGEGQTAARVLYDFANHAVPTLVWREEQKPVGKGNEEVGDMPHNWASAEFIRLTVHLLALDRGDELHLLEGLPRQWAGPGMVTQLKGIATPFGPLNLRVEADKLGRQLTVSVKPLAANCAAVVVHLPSGGTRRIHPQEGGRIEIPIRGPASPHAARSPGRMHADH